MRFLHSRQTRAGLLIAILGIAVLVAISSFAIGLLGSGVMYVMFAGTYRRLRRVLPPDPAATLTLVAAILVIVLPLTWLVGMLVDQAPQTLRSLQSGSFLGRLAAISIGKFQVGAEIAKASGTIVSWVSGQAFVFVGSAARATLNLVISFFGLFYLLTSGEKGWHAVREYVPFSPAIADQLKDRFFSVTKATLLGTALVSILQGSLIGVGFLLVGLPSPAFWGAITAIASVLPVLGSALVWLPAVLGLLLQEEFGRAIALAIIGGVVASNIDNVIRPLIYRKVSNIHPMITLIGAFAGVKYFGLLGVLLGPLAIAYFFELIKLYQREYGSGDDAPPLAATGGDPALSASS
ncbi:MAG: putative transport protein YdiK [Gemmatimonadaceae bacterium]|nr:putative transport protein YdiK [Gemmatimonadaceae bacterium]